MCGTPGQVKGQNLGIQQNICFVDLQSHSYILMKLLNRGPLNCIPLMNHMQCANTAVLNSIPSVLMNGKFIMTSAEMTLILSFLASQHVIQMNTIAGMELGNYIFKIDIY